MAFFIDICSYLVYSGDMLNGIRIYSHDPVWRKILAELGGDVSDTPVIGGLDFDSLNISKNITIPELRAVILSAMDKTDIIRRIFGRDITLSPLAGRIISCLYQSGGLSASELKNALGYDAATTTHTIDTTIYQLRKTYGRDLIQNNNGIYTIGKL